MKTRRLSEQEILVNKNKNIPFINYAQFLYFLYQCITNNFILLVNFYLLQRFHKTSRFHHLFLQ